MNTAFLTEIINQYGYLGIALLLAIENIFPPIPSEIVLAFTGFATLNTSLQIVPSIIFATLGALIGALVLYFLGKIISAERLEKFLAGKIGKLLHLKPEAIEKSANYFYHHGGSAVFFGRFIPVIRSLISIPAGMTSYPLGKFLALTVLGTLVWNTALIWLGRLTGHAWPHFVSLFEVYGRFILLLMIVGAVIYYWLRKKHRQSK
ncbi:DedA family protein [Liquorilactobacillus sicerae]|uniref:DedA family protein n=1 Tax=Liquorilactobacillus sicerae TaxID=1416943 RepID=UPI0024800BD3|nr:DedA family protein [Liquorilactobacillus sicerae]